MKGLIVGMGIGGLYKSVLTTLGYDIVTVDKDPKKYADYADVSQALRDHKSFDTVHICTPNFTHRDLTEYLAPVSKIIFVEKPGFKDSEEWIETVNLFPDTRFMMIKNNMWRENIEELVQFASESDAVTIEWIRNNCIPNPGSWFTTKELAYGGVSRDLMPHMLSLFIALNKDWKDAMPTTTSSVQNWKLEQIESTEYGVINKDGTHDVDDKSSIDFGDNWHLESNWRSMEKESSAIEFIKNNEVWHRFELGWCPEEAYLNMVRDAVANLNNDDFWKEQLEQDIWIHKQLEVL
jgi:predicted dehydrogenase